MELFNYPNLGKTRFYEIEAIQIPIVYNKYGDYDPDGLLYVLKRDADRPHPASKKRCSSPRISAVYQRKIRRASAAASPRNPNL